jgi:hypothetical protein
MALRYPYADPYLAPHITGAREDAAAQPSARSARCPTTGSSG